MSSLEGYAISSIKIDGIKKIKGIESDSEVVLHEFDSIPGVIEDVTNIILNLKKVRLRQRVAESENEAVTVTVDGSKNGGVFTAGAIADSLAGFDVLNPNLEICHLDPEAGFKLTLNIIKGRGYIAAEDNAQPNQDINTIAIDSIFTPILNVKYDVEDFRVEQKTDFEKLVIEITTDGSISPKDALKEAAKILIQHFMLFSDDKISLEENEESNGEEFDEEVLRMRQLLKTKLTDLDLSIRALNCLKAADMETLGELCQLERSDLLKFRNFGKKSLAELDEKLASMNLSFGMYISKYNLDKD